MQGFLADIQRKEKKKFNYALSGRVFFAVLCYNHINNYYSFYFSAGVPRAPEGRLIKESNDFLAIVQRNEKKDLHITIFDHIFSRVFFCESLRP
jgi:hypothetical protein